jgi:molecular chaperone DnaJ
MIKKDYYEVLGLARSTNPDEIKKAYRQMAMQYHPDRNPGNKEAEEKFKEASEAYEVLKDPEKRQIYDQYGHQGLSGSGFHGFSGVDDIFSSFSDIFEDFFGFRSSSFSGKSRGSRAYRGEDLRADAEITFEEAARGIKKEIEFKRSEICSECRGTKAKKGTDPVTCSHCHGSGQVAHRQGFFTISSTCSHCGGAGQVIGQRCETCHGKGKFVRDKKMTVKIPEGIDENARLRLLGEGEPGEGGGPSGDLYIFIHMSPHPFLKRDGSDTLCEVPISFSQAALGAEIMVETLEGERGLKIPKATQSGETLKIRGVGFPAMNGYRKGDQYCRVVVKTPTHLSKKAMALLKDFESELQIHTENKAERKGLFHQLSDFFTSACTPAFVR